MSKFAKLFAAGALGAGEATSDAIGDALRADAVAYWTMDEASGTRLDSTSNNNDLDDLNSVDSAAGKVGNALSFNDAGDYARLTSINFAFGDTSYSFAFWIRFSSLQSGADTAIFSQVDPGNTYEYSLNVSDVDSSIYFVMYTYVYDQVYSDSVILVDTWYFVVYEFDASANIMRFFINNLADGSESALSTPAPLGNRFVIGLDTVFSNGMTGLMDEFLVLPRITTSDERAYLYNAGAGRTLYP